MNAKAIPHFLRSVLTGYVLLIFLVGGILPHHHHGSIVVASAECPSDLLAGDGHASCHESGRSGGHRHACPAHFSFVKASRAALPAHEAAPLPLWLAACCLCAVGLQFLARWRHLARRFAPPCLRLPDGPARSGGGRRAPPAVVCFA